MPSRCRLLLCVVLVWLSGGTQPSAAEAQIRALPLTVAGLQPPPRRQHDDTLVMNVQFDEPVSNETFQSGECWRWQVLPDGLMYKSYLASGREPRFASQWIRERSLGWLWDVTLGGRVGMLRYGTADDFWPEGWQLDIEGAAFGRLSLERGRDMVAADFRFGVPLTVRQGPWEGKLSYVHVSSHLADEYLETFAWARRINYVRDGLVLGVALRPDRDVRLYVEADWAFLVDGGTLPWKFQFGVDYSPAEPSGACGALFFALNGQVREEVDYGGSFTVQTGWQWRGHSSRLLRVGMHYFNGKSDQHQFFNEHEEHIGAGLWYDY